MNDNKERREIDLWAPLKTCRLEKLAGEIGSKTRPIPQFIRFRCSECGRVFWFAKHGEIKFCPYCGAKDRWPR